MTRGRGDVAILSTGPAPRRRTKDAFWYEQSLGPTKAGTSLRHDGASDTGMEADVDPKANPAPHPHFSM
ncbi:MAG TPA: hypothetical protein VHU88_08680 [Sporichthyaceae bacterium]|nr:hypothetical protein [Sporichthyaceae bacterium]